MDQLYAVGGRGGGACHGIISVWDDGFRGGGEAEEKAGGHRVEERQEWRTCDGKRQRDLRDRGNYEQKNFVKDGNDKTK